MSEHDGGDFALQSDTKQAEFKPPPIAADNLKDPLTGSGLSEAKPSQAESSEAKGLSGGDFARLGDKLPL